MNNVTASDAMLSHVTVASPVKLPVLFAAGSRNALQSTVVPPPLGANAGNSPAIIIIVLSAVVLAAIFFTICGLLVKSQALVKARSNSEAPRMHGRFGSFVSVSMDGL